MSNKNRKRINIMIDIQLLEKLDKLIPTGERSNFANAAFEKALLQFGREKALEEIHESRGKIVINLSDEDLKKEIRYGLE